MANKEKKFLVVSLQRLSHRLYKKHVPVLPRLVFLMNRLLCGCCIPPEVELGEGVQIAHNGLGVVIHDKCVIGKGTAIQANVVLGGSNGRPGPKIGDNCYIGAGAVVIGDITVGNDAIIGANAVVNKDVPEGVVVAGVPAKIIKKVGEDQIGVPKR